MDEGNPLKILEFFAEVCLISPLFESRDQKMDIRGIPGYENVLKDWVKKNALGPIPSETATSHLRAKVRIKLYVMNLHSLNLSSLAEKETQENCGPYQESDPELALGPSLER